METGTEQFFSYVGFKDSKGKIKGQTSKVNEQTDP